MSSTTQSTGLEPLLNKILNEDCLEGMTRIPEKSVDMILCDLPYGTTQNKWDAIIPFEKLWEQYERVIKDNGAIVLTAAQPFSSALVMSNQSLFRYEWIWEKNTATGFMNANKMPLRAHENILVFYRELPVYNPQFTQAEPYAKKRNGNKETGENYGKVGIKEHTDIKNDGRRFPRSVVEFKREERVKHPTQKPVSLFEYLVKTYTNHGGVVLDNCMGSGTTAVACVNTDRQFIGFELDTKYHALAMERVVAALAAKGAR